MKFSSLLRELILENTSRYDVLLGKFATPKVKKSGKTVAPKMTKEELDEMILADPTSVAEGTDIKKVGKYSQWIIKQFLNLQQEVDKLQQYGTKEWEATYKRERDLFFEDLYKVTDDLVKFDRFKNRVAENFRDINKIPSMEKLYDLTKDFSLEMATTTKAERKESPTHPGGKTVYSGNRWDVIEIKDQGELGKEAACFYGGQNKETRWCTSAPGLSYFNRYIKDGPLYVIIDKTDTNLGSESGLPLNRYQFHFESNQFMDKDDRTIDLVKFFNGEGSELKDLFKDKFKTSFSKATNTNHVEVKYPQDRISKYIAIYGFDDFFDNLSPDLERFDFVGKIQDGNLDFPPGLTKYKNLNTIHIEGLLKNLPENIDEVLPNLQFISLPNNKNLKEIPSSLANLKNLSILNLKGTDASIPQSLQDKIDDNDIFLIK